MVGLIVSVCGEWEASGFVRISVSFVGYSYDIFFFVKHRLQVFE